MTVTQRFGLPSKGTFLEASSVNFISMYDVFTTGQFFCIPTAAGKIQSKSKQVTFMKKFLIYIKRVQVVSDHQMTVVAF